MKLLAAAWLVVLGSCVVSAPPPEQPGPGGPDPDEPYAEPASDEGEVVCAGSDDLEITGRTIESPTNGVVVTGSCDVIIEDSVINAADWAVVVTGSGDLRISNSVVQGGAGSVNVSGSGDIEASNTQFIGRIARSGSADFNDLGGNQFDH